MISDLPNSSTASKKKRDSAQKEFELAVEYVDEQLPCAHKKCTNPDGTVDWLDCAGCEEWFHNICVRVDPKIVNKAFKFYCSSCETPKSRKTKDSAESKMNKSFNTTPVSNISTNASDIPVSGKKISVTNPLKEQKSEAIQKLPLTMPCRISFSHLSRESQKSLGRTMKEGIEKQSETEESEAENITEPGQIGLSIEQLTESASLEQRTENSTPAENLTFTKIGQNWEFSGEKRNLEELLQNFKNVVPISPIKTPDQREIGEAKETRAKRNNTEGITKNQTAESFTVGPKWPFPPQDFILKRSPSEVMRNYRPLTVGPAWGFSDEEFNLDNSQIFEKIKELNWGPKMESKAYDALRLGHADQINQKRLIPATSLKTCDGEQRKIENAKQREAKRIQELKDREAKKIKESKEREAKEKKANTSYLTAFLEIDYNIPNNFSVKVTEEGKRRGPAKQTPFMKAVQERKRKIADENQSNSVQPTKMRKIGQ